MTTKALQGSAREAVALYFLGAAKGTAATYHDFGYINAADKTVRNVLCLLVNQGALKRTKAGYKTRSVRALRAIVA